MACDRTAPVVHPIHRIMRVRVEGKRCVLILGTVLLAVFAFLAPAFGLDYTPRIQGAPTPRIEGLLKGVADAFSLRDRPPASVEMLRKRVQEDASRMKEVLSSEGYYGAEVSAKVAGGDPAAEVVFQVDAGPLYEIVSVDVRFLSGESPFHAPALEDEDPVPLEAGAPARAEDVLHARDHLLRLLKNHGYPFAGAERPRAVVNHEDRAVRIELTVRPGPRAGFGPVRISGPERVEASYVRGKLAWKPGDRFSAALLDRTRDRLMGTGLFAMVSVEPAKSLDAEGRIPVHVDLKERKPRTVALGFRYRTDEGPGVQGSWKHRNLFGRAEQLALEATASPDLSELEGVFRKPEFLRPDQSLLAEADVGAESPEAYDSRRFRTAVGLERQLTDRVVAGGGVGLKVSSVDQRGVEETYALLSLPLRIDWDTSDDLLNPRKGWRLGGRLTPFVEVLEEQVGFVRGYASLTHYLPLTRDPDLLLATRWALGSIVGAERDEIPADERFYAGGGGSVRGLPFQSAGPLDGTEPVGGRSLLEVSGELRMRVTSSLGLVAFVDGGRAFEDAFPGSGGSMLWGAGLGVRYFTFLGPLRLDVAVPLDRREGVDDAFQFYVSIGQAF